MKIFQKSTVDKVKVFHAVSTGNLEKVRKYLKRGIPDINMHDDEFDQNTLLIIASRSGYLQIIKELVQANADINTVNKHGETPLHVACNLGDIEIVSFLWESRARCNICNKNGEIPLHYACKKGHASLVPYLVVGGDVNHQCIEGNTPLMWATYSTTLIVDLLLKARANPNIYNRKGRSALIWACRAGNIKVVELLLDEGADGNLIDDHGNSSLHEAVAGNHADIVELLIKRSAADPTQRNYFHQTPLDLARDRKLKDCIEVLIKFMPENSQLPHNNLLNQSIEHLI